MFAIKYYEALLEVIKTNVCNTPFIYYNSVYVLLYLLHLYNIKKRYFSKQYLVYCRFAILYL